MRFQHLLPVVAILLWSTVAHGQGKGQFLPSDPFVMTRLSYVIDADIKPESSLVVATMQLKFHNPSNQPLTEVWFQAGYDFAFAGSVAFDSLGAHEGLCVIDSVSMHGMTVGGDSVICDGNLLKVMMPGRIPPGETGYFQITFRTKMPASTYDEDTGAFMPILNWYPKVCGYPGGPYLADSVGTMYESRGERAAYDLRINVDTSLSLIFAAHLLNEKHHYGLLPRFTAGTVYEDFTNRHGRDLDGGRYEPIFDKAKKPYLLRITNVTGFPLIVSKGLIRDRVKDDSLAIEVCYRPSDAALWGNFVAGSAYELLKRLEIRMGPFTKRHVIVVAGEGDYMGLPGDRLLILPRTIDDPDLLYTALAFQLTDFWPHRLPSDTNSTMAFTLYTCVGELISARFVDNRDEVIEKYKTLRFKKQKGSPGR